MYVHCDVQRDDLIVNKYVVMCVSDTGTDTDKG